ncbi:glycerophosphodiester phosphodiesterase domain-containing protein 5 [Heptranchias perlo]|uniref:glycerophosphodiester phosphodiesterase domain-containing protein 5 n=1 Tax=Heptranchias perlo TaxID=212740 RepID=UPI00355A25CE
MMERHTFLQLVKKNLCLPSITGIYGCQWKQHSPPHPNKKGEFVWYLVLSCIFGISAFWFYCWWALYNDYSNLNEHLFAKIHRWLDWSVILLTVTAIIFSYLSLLMILGLCHFALGIPIYLHWINKVAMLISVLLILILMITIGLKWKEEWDTVLMSFQVTAPFLHIAAVVSVTIVAWFVAAQFFQSKRRVFQIVMLMFYLGVVTILYFIPLAISSPCIIEKKNLGPRPAMMGHRGAPMLAPENTMMSFEETVKCGASTFETDVRISSDGVPFLMHDPTFERTTNIAEVFPKKVKYNTSSFTWTEIQQLNAGKWFLEKDPYNTVRSLSVESQTKAATQRVFSLAQLLALARRTNKSVIFDLRPPTDRFHPYHNTSHKVIVDTILNSSIAHNLILWLPDNKKSTPSGFHQVLGDKLDPETLRRENIHTINVLYSNISYREIRNYAAENITTNVYVVNERWLFSILWCANVKSVTTNACHILKKMHEPIWHIPPGIYLAIWIITDIISFLLILLIFLIQRSRHRKKQEEFKVEEYDEDTVL